MIRREAGIITTQLLSRLLDKHGRALKLFARPSCAKRPGLR